ncbi:MAG: IclR family transcriptional regulator [Steroidobacteraceae bacterium]
MTRKMTSADSSQEVDQRYLVPGLLRGLQILHTFTPERQQQTIAEIARAAGITRTTAFRLVYTLEHTQHLRKVPNSRNYELGSRALDLSHAYLSCLDMIETANPILKALRDETQTSTHLMVLEGRDVVYIARFAGTTSLVSTQCVGSRLPAHATAPGRILLTGLTLSEIAALYENVPLQSYSGAAPDSIGALISRVEEDRRASSIVSWGAYEPSVAAIAAPVYGQDGKILAAISATCPLSTFSQEEFSTVIRGHVETAAMTLSRALGYRRPASAGDARR